MRSYRKTSLFLAVFGLLLATLACSSAQGSASPTSLPEENTAVPEVVEPVATEEAVATEEVQAETGGIYDGSWTGTNTVDNKEILFTVENNEIISVALNYTGESNGCDYHGAISTGSRTGGIDAITIDGGSFSAVVPHTNDELTFSGAFTSESEASGTLLIKSSADGLCGVYEKEISWTASKGSSADAEPTEDTSGLTSSEDAVAVVTQFFDAVNAGDLDSAMSLVDDNVMFSFGTANAQFGSGGLKSYLASSGVTYQISEAESFGGGMAQFKVTASDGTTYSFCTALLQSGKIISLSLQP